MTQEKVTATVVSATATPIDSVQQVVQNTTNVMNDVLNGFSNEAPKCETAEERQAKSFLNKFQDYIKSETFKNDVNETAKKYNIPPKQVAKGFFEKALGTVGDILGVAINVISNAGHMVINIIGTVAHGIINLISSIANGISRFVTLNKTCVSCA